MKPTQMKIVLTGKMSMTRDQEYERFKQYGVLVMSAVTSTTDYLVTGERPGRAKKRDALRHNTEVLSEDEFFDMLLEKYPEYLL